MPIFNIVKILPLLLLSSLSLALIDTKEFILLCDYPEQNKINELKHSIAQTNIDDFKEWLTNSNIDSIYTSPLAYAVVKNNLAIIKLILDACLKYRINHWELTTSTGMSMLSVAANEQYVDAIKLLLKYNHPVYMDKTNKTSALHLAASNNNITICKILIDTGGYLVHSKDSKHKTPVNYFIEHYEVDFVLELLERFPITNNIFPLDINGKSYLHHAVLYEIPNLTSYLVAVGFDYKQKDYSGVTPFGLARYQQDNTILQLLESEEQERKTSCCNFCRILLNFNKHDISYIATKQNYKKLY
jgi:ankyrin repeat protein